MSEPIQLVVGLGNPGSEYRGTRHNAGADFLEELARQNGATLTPESKFLGLAGRIRLNDHDLRLLIPTTFMNRSGQCVSLLARFYKIPPEAILVAHDELDFAPGTARFKLGGGHGGHNGLRDIVKALGNNANFYRLRLGIGHPGSAAEVSNYVLKAASQSDRRLIAACIDESIDSLPLMLNGDSAKAMSRLHSFTAS